MSRRVVELAAEYGRNLGLPCARRLVAVKGSLPWWPYGAPQGRWVVSPPALAGHVEFDLDVDLRRLFETDPEAAVELMAEKVGRHGWQGISLWDQGYAVTSARPLHYMLQRLADEVAEYAEMAFKWFYMGDRAPQIPLFPAEIVGGLADERVRAIMAAMQPEVDRETNRGGRSSWYAGSDPNKNYNVKLSDLPFEIQRRLAEARRFVFYRYGITGENFRSGTWSYWEVPCTCARS